MKRDMKVIRPRPETRLPRPVPVTEEELDHPSVKTLFRLIYNALVRLFHDPIGMLLGSAFLLIMLWGPHGDLELLGLVWDGWTGPGSAGDPERARILSFIPWDQEWLSFAAGVVLLVVVPIILIKGVFKQNLRDYGLGLPPRDRWGLTALASVLLLLLSAPAFYIGAHDAGMRELYPLYREFTSIGGFATYQIGYILFFIAIEFIFRGYLLFGLFGVEDREAMPGVVGARGPLVFGYYAILISMLSYTAWHLGKPVPELWGTLVWGIAAGTVALATRSIWHIVLVHWLLNVFMDLVIWKEWFVLPVGG